MAPRIDSDPRALLASRQRQNQPKTKAFGLTPRIRRAIDIIVHGPDDGGAAPATMAQAAKLAGLSPRSLQKAFDKPSVLSYYKAQMRLLRDGHRPANVRSLAEIRDDPALKSSAAGARARVAAIAQLETDPDVRAGINIDIHSTVNVTEKAGYVIDLSAHPFQPLTIDHDPYGQSDRVALDGADPYEGAAAPGLLPAGGLGGGWGEKSAALSTVVPRPRDFPSDEDHGRKFFQPPMETRLGDRSFNPAISAHWPLVRVCGQSRPRRSVPGVAVTAKIQDFERWPRLPEIRDNVVLTQAPRSSVSTADVADPFNSFAVALDGIGKAFEKEGLKDAAVKGSAAVVRDADGNLTVAENPYGGFGKMADAWERTAHMALLARGAIDDRAAAQKFALEANGNNDNFMAAWTPYKSKRVRGAPEAVRADVEINLDDLGLQTSGGIIAAARKRDDQVFAADHEALSQAQLNDILALARSGGMSSRAFKTALSHYRSLRQEMVANPAFSFSKTQFDLELKQLESAATGEAMIGEVERVYEKEGPRAAIELADSVLTKTDLGLSPGTARQLNGLMRGRIEDLRAGHAVDTKAIEDEADNLIGLFALGKATDNPTTDQLAEQLARSGKGAKATELLKKRRVAEAVRSLRAPGVTPADRVAAMESQSARASGGANLPIVTRKQAGRVSAPDMDGVEPVVIDRFRQLQNSFGRTIPVVSGFRDKTRNAKAGGAKHSQHIEGNALDLDVSDLSHEQRVDLIRRASAAGFTGIGVYANSLHVDVGGRRAWGASHHGDSVPAWAKDAIAEHMGGKIPLTARAASLPDAEVMAATGKSINEDFGIAWPSIKAGWEKYGTVDSQELVTIARQMPWLDDDKRVEVETFFTQQGGARIIDSLPPVEREAVISAMRGDAAGGATAMQLEILAAVDQQEAARSAAISADAQQFSRDRYSPIVGAVPPVDIGQGVDAFGKSLDAAQRHANFLRQREGTGPVSAFTVRKPPGSTSSSPRLHLTP